MCSEFSRPGQNTTSWLLTPDRLNVLPCRQLESLQYRHHKRQRIQRARTSALRIPKELPHMICVASDPPCHRHEQPSTDGLDELHSTPVSPLPTTTTDRTPVPCADNETWPCLHSSQWGDQDFPGHHPSQKQMDWIDKNSIYRLSDLPQRVRNQPWSMLNMTRQHTRSRTLPTRTAPVNHIPTGCPWQVFRAGRINYRDAGSYIQHWMDTHPRQGQGRPRDDFSVMSRVGALFTTQGRHRRLREHR